MKQVRVGTREIGGVSVFDLKGESSSEWVDEAAKKIQAQIRKKRMQRVILNFKEVNSGDEIGLRRILAACIRPKQSVIYGACPEILQLVTDNHLPNHISVCSDEKEVAEEFGPFLFDKSPEKHVETEGEDWSKNRTGQELERRRSHRMHVALPVHFKVLSADQEPIVTTAIATNISTGGMYAEYLDLSSAKKIEKIENLENRPINIHIFPSQNFPQEFLLNGVIRRKEMRKGQLGLGIEFVG